MLDSVREFFRDHAFLEMTSRFIIALAWGYALKQVWKHRNYPHANQVVIGATAMLIAQLLLIIDLGISPEVLLFFIALAQLTIAISYTRLFSHFRRQYNEVVGEQADAPEAIKSIYVDVLLYMASLGVLASIVKALV